MRNERIFNPTKPNSGRIKSLELVLTRQNLQLIIDGGGDFCTSHDRLIAARIEPNGMSSRCSLEISAFHEPFASTRARRDYAPDNLSRAIARIADVLTKSVVGKTAKTAWYTRDTTRTARFWGKRWRNGSVQRREETFTSIWRFLYCIRCQLNPSRSRP